MTSLKFLPKNAIPLFGSLMLLLGFFYPILGVSAQSRIQKKQRNKDFNPVSDQWFGMSEWMILAGQMGLKVKSPRVWDWKNADVRKPILIVAPRDQELDTKQLFEFVKQGGRVLIADDFGEGLPILRALGLKSARTPISPVMWKAQKYIDIHRTLPIYGQETDFLLRQANFLFLNIPQWLELDNPDEGESLLRSNPYRSNLPDRDWGGEVVFRIHYGAGTVVVVSDPSIFINQMIIYGDNKRFARNILRYLTIPTAAKELVLLWGAFRWQGKFTPKHGWLPAFNNGIWDGALIWNKILTSLPAFRETYPSYHARKSGFDQIGNFEAEQAAQLNRKLYSYAANLILLALLVVLWIGWLRTQVSGLSGEDNSYDQKQEEKKHLITNRFQEQVESYNNGYVGYLWPAILLKEEFFAFLAESYQLEAPSKNQNTRQSGSILIASLERKIQSGEVSQNVKEILPQLRWLHNEIPNRNQWGGYTKGEITAKQLENYHQIVMRFLRIIGLEEEFRKPFAPLKDEDSTPE